MREVICSRFACLRRVGRLCSGASRAYRADVLHPVTGLTILNIHHMFRVILSIWNPRQNH
jgi:hypothetical protein